jgi:hypothetical protein
MRNIIKSFFAFIIIVILQVIIFLLFVHPYILKWGATDTEVSMSMPGDKYAEAISSTRAISISKPQANVWKYLVQLGADRKGFYSYTFIENLYGCETTKQTGAENIEMKIGRLVPTMSPDATGKYYEGFYVVEVDSGRSFVLQNWGGFLVNEIDKNNTRLIIRTHAQKSNNIVEKLGNSIFDMLHYIMEKRMMLGVKDEAESYGENFNNSSSDSLWLLGIVISGFAGLVIILINKGYQKLLFSAFFYLVWQISLLILDPKPFYGFIPVMLAVVLIILIRKRNMAIKKK